MPTELIVVELTFILLSAISPEGDSSDGLFTVIVEEEILTSFALIKIPFTVTFLEEILMLPVTKVISLFITIVFPLESRAENWLDVKTHFVEHGFPLHKI